MTWNIALRKNDCTGYTCISTRKRKKVWEKERKKKQSKERRKGGSWKQGRRQGESERNAGGTIQLETKKWRGWECVRNGPFRAEQSAASSLGSDVFVTVSGFFSFIWVLEIKTQIFMIMCQAVYLPSHLHNLPVFFSFFIITFISKLLIIIKRWFL